VKQTLRQALIAFVATLLVIEVGLQLASLVARPLLARKSARDASRDTITILCVGDSHTYGAKLPDEESYPSQLRVLLGESYPEWGFNVVNLGFPGVNSAFVANRLESQILQIRPHLVMVSAGANNIWNSLETEAWATETGWDAVKRVLMRLKLFRLAAITWSTQTKYHFEPAEEGSSRWYHEDRKGRPIPHASPLPVYGVTYEKKTKEEELRGDGLARSIVFDMERIAALSHSYHIPVIWYNYPWPRHFPRVLQTIASTGAQLGIPVLQAEKDYARASADGHTLRTLGNSRGVGLHPSGILYGYIVESMVPLVEEALREWHGIDLSRGPEGGTPTPGG
jgi:lysophospholipase L1-like esterase